MERLLETVQNRMPPQTSLVMLTGKLNKAQTFYKRMEKLGHAEGFEEAADGKAADKNAFLEKIRDKLGELGLEMGMPAQKILAERTGYNLRQAENELEKLSLYVGDRGMATEEDVQEMVLPVLSHRVLLSAEARMRNMTSEKVLLGVLKAVPVPVRLS